MRTTTLASLGRAVAVCAIAIPFALAPAAHAKNGDPFIWDRGRQLGMVNRIDRVAA